MSNKENSAHLISVSGTPILTQSYIVHGSWAQTPLNIHLNSHQRILGYKLGELSNNKARKTEKNTSSAEKSDAVVLGAQDKLQEKSIRPFYKVYTWFSGEGIRDRELLWELKDFQIKHGSAQLEKTSYGHKIVKERHFLKFLGHPATLDEPENVRKNTEREVELLERLRSLRVKSLGDLGLYLDYFRSRQAERQYYKSSLERYSNAAGYWGDIYDPQPNYNWIDIVYKNVYYKSLLADRSGADKSASQNFNNLGGTVGLLEQKNFTPEDALAKLLSLNIPPAVAEGVAKGWRSSGSSVTRGEIDLVVKTYTLTKAASNESRPTLSPELAPLIPDIRFKSRPDPSVGAIALYNDHWMPAVEAGITQQQVNEFDPDILPAVQEEKRALAASGKPVPRIKLPRIGRGKLEKVLADPGRAQEYLDRQRSEGSRRSRESYRRRKAQTPT